MIRRPQTSADGRHCWVLISQIEHARISGELAEAWGGESHEPPWPEELLPAIYCHDDGWASWELAPDVEPASGAPRDFTEMPLDEALDIWRGSIAAAERIGPLAAYVVAGHFTALLRRAAGAGTPSPERSPLGADFLSEQALLQARRLAAWRADDPRRDEAAAKAALAWLQFFDALSLWLCCRERTEPHEVHPPAGGKVTFAPQDGTTIAVAPWPFSPDKLSLRVPGRSVPQARYLDRAALADAQDERVVIAFRLRRVAG